MLVVGGNDPVNTTRNAELYDPASGSWTSTGSLNTEVQNCTSLPRVRLERRTVRNACTYPDTDICFREMRTNTKAPVELLDNANSSSLSFFKGPLAKEQR